MGSTGFNEQIKMKTSMCEALWEAERYWEKRGKRYHSHKCLWSNKSGTQKFFITDLGER